MTHFFTAKGRGFLLPEGINFFRVDYSGLKLAVQGRGKQNQGDSVLSCKFNYVP
jgi:hypothetical protein